MGGCSHKSDVTEKEQIGRSVPMYGLATLHQGRRTPGAGCDYWNYVGSESVARYWNWKTFPNQACSACFYISSKERRYPPYSSKSTILLHSHSFEMKPDLYDIRITASCSVIWKSHHNMHEWVHNAVFEFGLTCVLISRNLFNAAFVIAFTADFMQFECSFQTNFCTSRLGEVLDSRHVNIVSLGSRPENLRATHK